MDVRKVLVFCVVALVTGCGNDDATGPRTVDVSGTYTLTLKNGPNTCAIPLWVEGDSTVVEMTLDQGADSVSARLQGQSGSILAYLLGTDQFSGTASGATVVLTAKGTRQNAFLNCTYTVDAVLNGTISSDKITGTLTYTPSGNQHADCFLIQSCQPVQTVTGIRAQ